MLALEFDDEQFAVDVENDASSDDEIEFISCDSSFQTNAFPMPITIKNEDILTGLEKFTVDVRKSLIILIEAHRKGIFFTN